MAFSTRVAPAVLKAIRNPVICANVARKARRGKFSRDIFLPFNIDIGGWPFDCLYQYDTFPNARDGMDGGDDDQWLLLVIYRLRKGSSITFHFFSFYIYSGNINLEIYKNEKIVNRR